MAKLKQPPARLGTLSGRLVRMDGGEAARSRRRDQAEPWRAWYKTARWQKLRWSILVRDLFTCAFCGALVSDTSQLVCDHVERHGGNEARFWAGPFQALCRPCHDGAKKRIERRRDGRRPSAHPEWLQPSAVDLSIVCGPPASGKTTWIAERAESGDCVVDLDQIVATMTGGGVRHDWSRAAHLDDALWRRNEMLAGLARRRTGRAWLAVMEPAAARRRWWRDKLGAVEVVVLEASVETCLRRAAGDADRDAAAVQASAEAWWATYEPARGETRVRVG